MQPCEIISQLDYKDVIRQSNLGGPGHETVNCPQETQSHFEGRVRYSWLQRPFYFLFSIFFLAGEGGNICACTQTRAVPSSAWRPLEMNRN